MSNFNFCQNCQLIRSISEDLTCDGCGELICLVCGCTESTACTNFVSEGCSWSRPGVCSNCDVKNLSGESFYSRLDIAKNMSFADLSTKDKFVFNTIADIANDVLREKLR